MMAALLAIMGVQGMAVYRHALPRGRVSAAVMMTAVEMVGSVDDVIHGVLPAEAEHRVLAADALRSAFIVGSPTSVDDMGEMLTVNGKAYCCSTAPGAAKHALRVGDAVFTTGACVLPLHAQADARLDWSAAAEGPADWAAVCARAVQAAGGVAVVLSGFVTFERLVAVQIAEPPIRGEFIFAPDVRSRYYSVQPCEVPGARCFVMGAACPVELLAEGARAPELQRMLYAGGAGIAGRDARREPGVDASTSHTHALELDPACGARAEAEITPDIVRQVLHVSAESAVAEARLELFRVDEVVEHTEGLEYVPKACC